MELVGDVLRDGDEVDAVLGQHSGKIVSPKATVETASKRERLESKKQEKQEKQEKQGTQK